MPRPRCDFCNSTEVRWGYPTRDLTSELQGRTLTDHRPFALALLNSTGGWAACDPCHDLIERGLRDELALRAAEAADRGRVPLALIIEAARHIHDDFWANREGPPIPASPDDFQDPTRPTT